MELAKMGTTKILLEDMAISHGKLYGTTPPDAYKTHRTPDNKFMDGQEKWKMKK